MAKGTLNKGINAEKRVTTRSKATNNKEWFSDLLLDINLSTTKLISETFPGMEFSLLEQNIFDTYVVRKIAFSIHGHLVCKATNKVYRNDLVNAWLLEKPNEPFGTVFRDNKQDRTLLSKTDTSRKFSVTGDMVAEIEEEFYPAPAA